MCTQMTTSGPVTYSPSDYTNMCMCTEAVPPKEEEWQINSPYRVSINILHLECQRSPQGPLELSIVSANGLGQHPRKEHSCLRLRGGAAVSMHSWICTYMYMCGGGL